MGARCSRTGKAGKVDAAGGRFRRQCARAQWRGRTTQLEATSVAGAVMRKAREQMQVRGKGAVGVGGRGVVVVEGGSGGVCTSPRPLLTSPHGRAARWAAGLLGCWLAGLSAAVLSPSSSRLGCSVTVRARAPSPQSSAARSPCSSNNSPFWRTAVVSAVSLFLHQSLANACSAG